MSTKWSALPTWWVRERGLVRFSGSTNTGESIAALKVAIALALLSDYKSRKARNSLSELEIITGLSRPMVLTGTTMLEENEVVKVDRSKHVNEYELTVTDSDTNWAKIPYELMRVQLPNITNRGAITLAALKTYLLLVSRRPNQSPSLAMGHELIRSDTGIQTKHVRPAIDVLLNHNLIGLNRGGDTQTSYTGHNIYTISGLKI